VYQNEDILLVTVTAVGKNHNIYVNSTITRVFFSQMQHICLC